MQLYKLMIFWDVNYFDLWNICDSLIRMAEKLLGKKLSNKSACDGVLRAIRSIIRSVELQSKMLDQKYGLTGPQLHILKELEGNQDITTSELAANISISQSTATIIIDRLVEKQLVERVRDTIDKRKWFIALTAKGRQLLQKFPPLLHSNFVEQFTLLPEWKQNQTLSVLQHVVAMFNSEALIEDSAPIIVSGKDLL